jgi:hypothetical protein
MPLSQIIFLHFYWNSFIALKNLTASSNSSLEGLRLSATVITFCSLFDLSVTTFASNSIFIYFFSLKYSLLGCFTDFILIAAP